MAKVKLHSEASRPLLAVTYNGIQM